MAQQIFEVPPQNFYASAAPVEVSDSDLCIIMT